jgi:hypothetical protein
VGPIAGLTKERKRPETGSLPDLLRLFEHALRFYSEIAPEVGARVPECSEALETVDGRFRPRLDATRLRRGPGSLGVATGAVGTGVGAPRGRRGGRRGAVERGHSAGGEYSRASPLGGGPVHAA